MSIYTKYVKELYDENVLKIEHWAVNVGCILYGLGGGIYCGTVRETKKNIRYKVDTQQSVKC